MVQSDKAAEPYCGLVRECADEVVAPDDVVQLRAAVGIAPEPKRFIAPLPMGLGVDVKVTLTPLCIFCIKNRL